MNTFYWHDYETWGANPSVDRPSQFAGVRTDSELNIIGEPLVIYCKPPEDIWPHPEACLITGITPQYAEKNGLLEHEFIKKVYAELSQKSTCGVGYNSIRFDDEITRYTLFRNLYDPYEREWKNGNSRWDIIDMVRLVYALRPEGIEWPMIDGIPSFKLENLSTANGLAHGRAHDAYSDVEATIQLAQLIKAKQPALYDYVLNNKSKHQVAAMIDVKRRKPLFHISSKFGAQRGCSALIAPIVMHPTNRNSVIVIDLSCDPSVLQSLSVKEIRERIFTRSSELADGVERLPIKEIHFNKSPIVATTKLCDKNSAKRLHIDKALCEKNWQKLITLDIGDKVKSVFSDNEFQAKSDPEQMLYDGFIPDKDKPLMQEVRLASADELRDREFVFQDKRLKEIFFRYKARNYPGSLSDEDQGLWVDVKQDRLNNGGDNILSKAEFLESIQRNSARDDLTENHKKILSDLNSYAINHD